MSWFNYYGLIIMLIIMVPNVIYAATHKNAEGGKFNNRAVIIAEQAGRYGCFALMIFNIPYTYFNFWFNYALTIYLAVNGALCAPADEVSGDVYIGGGESYAMQIIAAAAHAVQSEFPKIKFHLFSGDSATVSERLDKGLIDFGIFIEPFDLSRYEYIRLPLYDTWGVLMRRDSPLAQKERITPQDLWDKPLIRSRQSMGKNKISDWFEKSTEELNVVATGNLLYNMSLLVEEGLGYAVTLDKLINTTGNSDLCFRPLYPELISHLDIAWKQYQVFPKCAEIFLKRLRENL